MTFLNAIAHKYSVTFRTSMRAQNPVMYSLSTSCVISGASCPVCVIVWFTLYNYQFQLSVHKSLKPWKMPEKKRNTVLVNVLAGHYQTPNSYFIKEIIFVLLRMEKWRGKFHVPYCTVFLEHKLPWLIHAFLSSHKYLSQKMFV